MAGEEAVSPGWRIRRPRRPRRAACRSGWPRCGARGAGASASASRRRDGCDARHEHLRAVARLHDRTDGSIASGMHMCQGACPWCHRHGRSARRRTRLIESMPPKAVGAERSLFDGIDVSLGSLARYAGDRAPQGVTAGLMTSPIGSRPRRALRHGWSAGDDSRARSRADRRAPPRRGSRHDRPGRWSQIRDRCAAADQGTAAAERARDRARRAHRCNGERWFDRPRAGARRDGGHREPRARTGRREQRGAHRIRDRRQLPAGRGDDAGAVYVQRRRRGAGRRAPDRRLLAAA